jgi:hypothetical protein
MKRILLSGLFALTLGCAVPAERMPLQPLPENGQVLPYAELLTRVRSQSRAALGAYYLDHWAEVEDLAKGMEQTARFLSKAEDIPKTKKDVLTEVSGDLAKNAKRLREAAAAKNAKDTSAALQQIYEKVRELRLED